jgi:hypothetical protein
VTKAMVFSFVLLIACHNTTEPTVRRLADLGAKRDQRIDAPDTVRANTPFAATVYFVGSTSVECNTPDGTSVSNDGRLARVQVFMRVPNRGYTCPSDFKLYPQTTMIQFSLPGISVLRLVGGHDPSGLGARDSVDRTIVVLP